MIGITAQIQSESGGNEGVGFAIPSNTVRSIADQLISTGKAQHALLGVERQDGVERRRRRAGRSGHGRGLGRVEGRRRDHRRRRSAKVDERRAAARLDRVSRSRRQAVADLRPERQDVDRQRDARIEIVKERKKSRRAGGAFVHLTDRPIRACALHNCSARLRSTRAPCSAGSGIYDARGTRRKGVRAKTAHVAEETNERTKRDGSRRRAAPRSSSPCIEPCSRAVSAGRTRPAERARRRRSGRSEECSCK